jgi:hypothetical protein
MTGPRGRGMSFFGGRHLERVKAGGIDVPLARAGSKRLERACASGSISVVERDVRGFERRGAKQSKRLPRFPTAPSAPWSRSARSRRRAVKHGAVGGRMTARWSGIVPRRTAATPRNEEDLEAGSWRVYPR